MTKLATRKTRLSFTTGAEIRYRGKMRAVVIEVDNPFIASVRLSGTRQRYQFSWHWLHDAAADLFSRAERDRKKKERIGRRKARP